MRGCGPVYEWIVGNPEIKNKIPGKSTIRPNNGPYVGQTIVCWTNIKDSSIRFRTRFRRPGVLGECFRNARRLGRFVLRRFGPTIA